ncbi:MAG: hypothetical protein Q9162_007977, partial [Coniocarpon cinnabarinum]
MSAYDLLPAAAEDSLHTSRLLNIEDKHFKRLSRRLLDPTSPLALPLTTPPTPPPDSSAIDEAAAANASETSSKLADRATWLDEARMDFHTFESNIQRVRFLLQSNDRERARYTAETAKIRDTAESVRLRNTELRAHLAEAQATLSIRKEYDALARSITSHPALKPRHEQHDAITKLETEIAELTREREAFQRIWKERREQFGRIVEEGEG